MILFVVLKVIKCKLAVERKGNVVATGTLIEEKWSNRLVVINVAHKPDARLPFPNPWDYQCWGCYWLWDWLANKPCHACSKFDCNLVFYCLGVYITNISSFFIGVG